MSHHDPRHTAQTHCQLLLLQHQGIIYRDVKPDNFLFLTAEPESPLKATDFGLSIRHASHEPKLTSRSGAFYNIKCSCVCVLI